MRLLVYSEHSMFDEELLENCIGSLIENYRDDPVEVLIRTGVGQIDIEMEQWATIRGIPSLTVTYPGLTNTLMSWRVFNNHLLNYGKPDMILAFPGRCADHMEAICAAQKIRFQFMEYLEL